MRGSLKADWADDPPPRGLAASTREFTLGVGRRTHGLLHGALE